MAKSTKSNGQATTQFAKLEYHPLANLFPLLGETEIQTLSDDIRHNGLNVPVTMYEGKILDGRNRYAACILAGVTPAFVDYEGQEPVKFVVSTNLHRRHLNESQRAMVAAKLANMRQGERTDREPCANLRKVDQTEAATLLNTSRRSVQQAKKVETEAVPEVVAAVEQGKVSVSIAATIAEATPENSVK